jgi:hypothetical protein
MSEQMEGLRDMFAHSDAGNRALGERVGHLMTGVERLTHRLEADTGLGEQMTRLADGQERLIAAFGVLAERLDTSSETEAEMRMRLRSIDVQLLRLLEEVSAGRQESMAELRHDFAGLTRAILSRRNDQGQEG